MKKYLALIAVLLIPISLLGNESISDIKQKIIRSSIFLIGEIVLVPMIQTGPEEDAAGGAHIHDREGLLPYATNAM